MWPVLEPGRAFVSGWAVDAICEHLEAVTAGQIKKLAIIVPPGCMKSMTTCVFWPAWEWGPKNRADLRYVCASYSIDLTTRDNRRCRQIIDSPLYQAMWGDRFRIVDDQDAKKKFETDKRGFKLATSVGGVGTGERGDRFIIDDAHNIKVVESDAIRGSTLQWFTEVVPTRITDPETSAQVVIGQRTHEYDVLGMILAKLAGYTVLCLPMEFEPDHPQRWIRDPRKEYGELLWPERFSREYLETDLKPSLRAWGGSYAEAGQLQQRPSPRGGGMFRKDWLRYLDAAPALDDGAAIRSWDLASTEGGGDWTVGVKVRLTRDKRVVIEDVVRVQKGPGDVDDLIEATAKRDGPRVRIVLPQDPGSAGKALAHSIIRQRLQGYTARAVPQTGSKEDRARPLASQAEIGNLYVVRASWTDTFVDELGVFPRGAHDDQVDAAAGGYNELVMRPDVGMDAAAAQASAPRLLRGAGA